MYKEAKKIGIIGLGNMGRPIAETLLGHGYSVFLYDPTASKYDPFRGKEGAVLSESVDDLTRKLHEGGEKAIVWSMIPGGEPTNTLVSKLSSLLSGGDTVIDASNSIYTDSIANYGVLKGKGVFYLDVGCGGGPEDMGKGVSLMVGGDREAFDLAEDIFEVVAGEGSFGYVGGSGAGHMTKTVHNVIFYGIFPVYAEGIDMLARLKESFPGVRLDLDEAVRLLSAAPPINAGIMKSIRDTEKEWGAPGKDVEIHVSEMVRIGISGARACGATLYITKAILGGYQFMAGHPKRIYALAKRRLTGH